MGDLRCLSDYSAGAVFLTEQQSWLNEELVAFRTESLEDLAVFGNKTVCLSGNPLHIIKWLVLLDGIASRIILCPVELVSALRDSILSNACPDMIILDDALLANGWPANVSCIVDDHSVEYSNMPKLALFPRAEQVEIVSTQWVLATSGTTGTPKLVIHTLASLIRTVSISPKNQNARWALLYDPCRFAGLQVLLQAIVSGAALLIPRDGSLSNRLEWLGTEKCDAISATATLWRKCLMSNASAHLSLKLITLGGEIVDGSVLKALRAAFPTAHITHIYASTEVGVAFAVHDGLPGFPAEWLESGVSVIDLKISDDSTLHIKHKSFKQNYLGSDDLYLDNGWIDTGDVVEIKGDRVLFKGRISGSINIGGSKVMPEEVETVVAQMPGVEQVLVRGKTNSVTGQLVEALIVVDEEQVDKPAFKKMIKLYCRERLADYKVPALIKFVPELEMTAAGKLGRNA